MVPNYPKKNPLLILAFLLSAVFWLGLGAFLLWFYGTYGRAWFLEHKLDSVQWLGGAILILTALLYVGNYLRNAYKVACLRGYGVEITPKQFTDLNGRIKSVCKRLEIEDWPIVYLFRFNRFDASLSVTYQNQDHISLDAETIGALTERQTAIDFLIGFELAHLYDPASRWRYFLWPALVTPLIGPAFQRACIYSYDLTGLTGCRTKVDSALALALSASGTRRWKSLSIPHFASQSEYTKPFLMSLLELMSARPWLPKRMARLRALATDSDSFIPRRNPIAYLLALFIPYANFKSATVLAHLLAIALWLFLSVFWGLKADQYLEKNKLWPYATIKSSDALKAKANKKKQRNVRKKSKALVSPYSKLYKDLKSLGSLAMKQYKNNGVISCEIDNVDSLKLNYSTSRYAYSCDEAIVYTRVKQGEFEGGRSAHVVGFDWKERKIIRRQQSSDKIK